MQGPGVYVLLLLKVLYLVRRFQPTVFTLAGLFAGITAVIGLYRYRHGGMHALMGGPFTSGDAEENATPDELGLRTFLTEQRPFLVAWNSALFLSLTDTITRFQDSWTTLANGTHPLFNQEYDNLRELKHEALNTYHSFVHSLQRHDMDTHASGMQQLKALLNDGLNSALTVNNRRNQRAGISTLTKFHHRGSPSGNDPAFDRRFGFFQV